MPEPLRIVLTGGPGGGKTGAQGLLATHYRNLGYPVYTAPEIPTLLHHAGVDLLATMAVEEQRKCLLRSALSLQTTMEAALNQLSRHHSTRPILLFDRGINDFKAYYPDTTWVEVVNSFPLDAADGRDYEAYCYDLVFHLTTAAIGAENYFTNDNNPARQCTPELARQLDRQTRAAWQRNVIEIDNSTDFNGKIQRIIQHIDRELKPQ